MDNYFSLKNIHTVFNMAVVCGAMTVVFIGIALSGIGNYEVAFFISYLYSLATFVLMFVGLVMGVIESFS